MFKRKKRAPEPVVEQKKKPETCAVCDREAMEGFGRCYRHLGVVFDSHAQTDAPETRGA